MGRHSSPSLSSLSSLPGSPICLDSTDSTQTVTMPQLGGATSDKLLQEMSSLPQSTTAITLAATTSRTPAASPMVTSPHGDHGRSGATSGTSAPGSTANPVFLSRIITGAVSEVLSSTPSSG